MVAGRLQLRGEMRFTNFPFGNNSYSQKSCVDILFRSLRLRQYIRGKGRVGRLGPK